MFDPEELRMSAEIDQALAEGIEVGALRVVGTTEAGETQYEMTAKGLLSAVVYHLSVLIGAADSEKRDLNAVEKAEAIEYLSVIMEGLVRK